MYKADERNDAKFEIAQAINNLANEMNRFNNIQQATFEFPNENEVEDAYTLYQALEKDHKKS